MSAPTGAARGLLVGRFQPFHRGHLEVVRAIRAERPDEELVLAIGSAQVAYTFENPFTAAERFELIVAALREARLERVLAVPLPDIGRHALWVAHSEETLPPFRRVHTNNPLTRLLFERAGYPVDSPRWVDRDRLEGRRIRERLADDDGWEPLVPGAVALGLRSLGAPARLRLLRGGPGTGSGSVEPP